MVNVSALLVSRGCSKNLLGPMDSFSLPLLCRTECTRYKVAENCLDPWPLDQQWTLSRSLAAKEVFRTVQSSFVNNAVNTYPLQ